LAGISAIPPFGALLLVGLYRFRSTYFDLYYADRYFFLLFIPIALLAGAVAASISLSGWPRVARIALMLALACGLTGEIALHRRAMLRRISVEGYAVHGRRYATLELLVRRLENAGSFEIPHNRLWFDAIYDRIDSAVLTNVISDGKGLRLGTHVDERRLNPLLDAWAREIGETVPFIRVVDGNLVNTQFPTTVDFSKVPGDALITGFYGWEKPSRWMSARGELYVRLASPDLELRLAAPVSDLRRKYPAWTSIPVRVTLVDIETDYAAPLGVIQITEDGIHDYHLPTSPMISHGSVGLIVEIRLECDRAWKPSDVYGTADTREHTVQVFSAGPGFSSSR
jgi:hypothetical protein